MAVYTKLTEDKMEEVLANFTLGEIKSVDEIPEGILNTNYLINAKESKYILRILEGNRVASEEIKELNFLNHLCSNGFPCPVAVKTSEKKDHIFVEEKMTSVFTFIDGEKVREIDENCISEIGSKLGMMHRLLRDRDIKRSRKIDMEYFYDLISKVNLKEILGVDHGKIIDAYKKASAIDYSNLPHGIIHNDIFPDNVFIKEGKISGIIDFNDSMRGPLIFDLAIVINFWIRNKGRGPEKENELIEALLEAYGKERPLEEDEMKLLDEAILRIALTFIFLRVNKFHVEDNEGINMEFKDYRDLLPLLDYFN